MKRCPQCDAQYDDHVEYCFVDGTELVRATAPATAPLPPPPSTSPSTRALPLMVVFGSVAALALIAVVVVLLMLFAGGSDPSPAPSVPQPSLADVEPEPDRPAPTFQIRSTPSGAAVFEGRTRVCEKTPCDVPHPAHAPTPRTFMLRLANHADTAFEMTDPTRAHTVALQPLGLTPQPVRPAVPSSSAAADVPDIMDER